MHCSKNSCLNGCPRLRTSRKSRHGGGVTSPRPETVTMASNPDTPVEPRRHGQTANAWWPPPIEFWALVPSFLAFAWLISKAQWFWNHQPDLQFGWVVVALCAFLFWEAWESRPAPEFGWNWFRCTALAFGCGLLFLVQVYQAAFGTQPASMAG